MKITYYGHACFGVEIKGVHLLFDPFIRPNELAAHIDIDSVKADYILQSHAHEDHIADTVYLAKKNGSTVVSNYEIVVWLGKQGVEKGHPMNHGGSWEFEFGTVKYVNAVHSSSFPDGSYGGNPGGFVVTTAEGSFYFAGDTALTYDMKLIGEEFDLKCAILPLGDNFTMGVKDAVKCAEYIDCQEIIGMHYDTFGYIKIDHAQAVKTFKEAGKNLHLVGIGKTIEL